MARLVGTHQAAPAPLPDPKPDSLHPPPSHSVRRWHCWAGDTWPCCPGPKTHPPAWAWPHQHPFCGSSCGELPVLVLNPTALRAELEEEEEEEAFASSTPHGTGSPLTALGLLSSLCFCFLATSVELGDCPTLWRPLPMSPGPTAHLCVTHTLTQVATSPG